MAEWNADFLELDYPFGKKKNVKKFVFCLGVIVVPYFVNKI